MLIFQNISKRFGNHEVLKEVNFKVGKGDFVVLTGPSGSGKTTLLHMIIGKLKPTSGNIFIDGQPLATLTPHSLQIVRRNIGVVFQDFELLPYKTVFENVAFVLEACEKPVTLIAERVMQALSRMGIAHRKNAFPRELSGGEKQRAAIARAIVHNPPLLLADEPTGNLDQENVEAIIALLQDIHANGTAVILTTHNKEIIKHFQDRRKRFVNLRDGHLVEQVGTLG